MKARLEAYAHWRKAEALNAMREAVVTWQNIGTVRMALSTGGGSLNTQNELLRIDSTHTAATWDAVQVGDRLREPNGDGGGTGYEVTYIIDGGRRRMHQLFLKREDEPPDREVT